MAIRFIDFDDIPLSPLGGPISKNAPKNNNLVVRFFYEDTWRDKAKGIITHHLGEAGTVLPGITHGLVQGSVPKGYALAVILGRSKSLVGHRLVNNYPSYESPYGAIEQQSVLDYIYNVAMDDGVLSKFIGPGNKTLLTGTSQAGLSVLQWSQLTHDSFSRRSTSVMGIISDAPMQGSDAANGSWAQTFRALRAVSNTIIGIRHNTMLIWPKGDKTYNVRSFSERLKPVTRLNSKVKPVVYGTDATYDHKWSANKPLEFIGLAVSMFDEYLKG